MKLQLPKTWKTACYDHEVTKRKIGLFSSLMCCSCGMSAKDMLALYNRHVSFEIETQKWLQGLQQKWSKRP